MFWFEQYYGIVYTKVNTQCYSTDVRHQKQETHSGNDPLHCTQANSEYLIRDLCFQSLVCWHGSSSKTWNQSNQKFIFFFFHSGKKTPSSMKRLSVICMRKDNIRWERMLVCGFRLKTPKAYYIEISHKRLITGKTTEHCLFLHR